MYINDPFLCWECVGVTVCALLCACFGCVRVYVCVSGFIFLCSVCIHYNYFQYIFFSLLFILLLLLFLHFLRFSLLSSAFCVCWDVFIHCARSLSLSVARFILSIKVFFFSFQFCVFAASFLRPWFGCVGFVFFRHSFTLVSVFVLLFNSIVIFFLVTITMNSSC